MRIYVDGKEAVLKEGKTFDYVSENPLFTDAGDYSMEIEFPLKDQPENVMIFGPLHVKGVDVSKVTYPCEIDFGMFVKKGFLTIIEVSESAVKCQFLEGMSTKGYNTTGLDLYIDEIDFSPIDGTNGQTSTVLNPHAFADLPVWDKDEDKVFDLFGSHPLLKHIYLHVLVDWIATQADVDVDYTGIDRCAWYLNLVVCNTSDYIKYIPNVYPQDTITGFYFMKVEKTLPHWTVKEFFQNLAKLLGCKAIFDKFSGKVTFMPVTSLLPLGGADSLSVTDEFSIETQDSENMVDKATNFKFPDECNPENINNCMWIYDYIDDIKVVRLIDSNQYNPTWLAQNPYGDDVYYRKSRLYESHNLIGGIYAAITSIEKRDDVTHFGEQLHFVQFEVLNQFAADEEAEELKIYPANLEWKRLGKILNKWGGLGNQQSGKPGWIETDSSFANPYKMPVVSIAKYRPSENLDNDWFYNAGDLIGKGTPKVEVKGIQLVLFASTGAVADGSHLNTRKWEPVIGTQYAAETIQNTEGIVPNYYSGIHEYDHMIMIGGGEFGTADRELPKVDETQLYRYKFLGISIPSPTKIFRINGQRYACQRISAQFTNQGMSELMEGEFYRIID